MFVSILPDIFDGFVLLFSLERFQRLNGNLSLSHILRSMIIVGILGGFVFAICFIGFFIFLDIKAMKKEKE
jgi:hypothetical protein